MKIYRNEWKYRCKKKELDIWSARLSSLLDLDEYSGENGKYHIHSLYFDDIYDSCAKDNDAGVSKRYKYRIRYYGEDNKHLHLEKKEKYNGRCFKISCELSQEQYDQILAGDIEEVFWNTSDSLLQSFCVDCWKKGFRPKAIIDYERVAFVEPLMHIRITLDENISVSNDVEAFLSRTYQCIPLQEKEQHVLEVKFDSILPSYVRHAITDSSLVQTSFSKYYLGRKQLQRMV